MFHKVRGEDFDINYLERDTRNCFQIWEYPMNEKDKIKKKKLI